MNSELFKLPLPIPALFDASTRLLGLAVALGAIVLAGHWLTELSAPRPVARLPSAALVQPEAGNLIPLFGGGEAHTQAIEGLTLSGVFAGSRAGGFATFRTPAGAVSIFPGEEVVPGVTLKQIERDRVILQSAATTKELLLSMGPVSADSGQPAAPVTPAAPSVTVPAQIAPEQMAAAPGIPAANRSRSRNRNRSGDEE